MLRGTTFGMTSLALLVADAYERLPQEVSKGPPKEASRATGEPAQRLL